MLQCAGQLHDSRPPGRMEQDSVRLHHATHHSKPTYCSSLEFSMCSFQTSVDCRVNETIESEIAGEGTGRGTAHRYIPIQHLSVSFPQVASAFPQDKQLLFRLLPRATQSPDTSPTPVKIPRKGRPKLTGEVMRCGGSCSDSTHCVQEPQTHSSAASRGPKITQGRP